MKIKYITKKFNPDHLLIIDRANAIIAQYQAQGYVLNLRQIYYQFVSRDWLANKQENYNKLGVVISNARRAGLIDWAAIEDRTRNLVKSPTWDNPADIVAACASQFTVDLWEGQTYRPECWVEKDALMGILEVACRPFQVPYFSCRGYTSDSEVHAAAQRLARYDTVHDQTPIIIHLGDHDPSGIDMTRDVFDRIRLFSSNTACNEIEVRRIALNWDQIEQYQPPPNPAKVTDARYKAYEAKHGDESWELDALQPEVINALITQTIEGLIDQDSWDEAEARRDQGRKQLSSVSSHWGEIVEKL